MADELRRSSSRHLGSLAQARFERFVLAFKFDPNQPRDDRGRWADTGGDDPASEANGHGSITIDAIVSRADKLNLAARSDAYEACLDLCYPLLERFQPPGSDKNTWDFHKCMNICLGKARK